MFADRRAALLLGKSAEASGRRDADADAPREATAASMLTLDDLILGGGGGARAAPAAVRREGEVKAAAPSGTLFSRAPVVVTGWDNPHRRADARAGDANRGGGGFDRGAAAGGARRGAGRPPQADSRRDREDERRRHPARPTELAGARAAIGVVRDYVDYNAGYLSPSDVNGDLDAPPSPIRGFEQRLMSLDDDDGRVGVARKRGNHTRKRATTTRSPDPQDAFSYEQQKKRARAKRAAMKEAEALVAAAKRIKPRATTPDSDSGAPWSASRAGRALHAPQAFWASGKKREKEASRGGRKPAAAIWSDDDDGDEEDDVRAAVGGGHNANAERALHRIRNGTVPVSQNYERKRGKQTGASVERKGKPGPKPGLAAAKKAAMIAAGIPIPVLPPGVKRGRGRPPRSMLIVPDGPVNSKLPPAVIKNVAKVDPKIVRKIIPVVKATTTDDDEEFDITAPHPPSDVPIACIACGRDDEDHKMLLCDGCDKGYHTHCLVPKLSVVPDAEWFCYECVTAKRPKTAAAEAFERRQAEKAASALAAVRYSPPARAPRSASATPKERVLVNQRVSDKVKLNGERKLKPGPKPKSMTGRQSFDANVVVTTERKSSSAKRDTDEKRSVGRPKKDPNAWTEEQIEALQNAQVRVDLGRKNFWTEVASYVPGKSAQQCKEQVYAGLGVGGSGDENTQPEHRDEDREEDIDQDDEDEDDVSARDNPTNRTFLTPTKPTTSTANIERWRMRRPSNDF